MPGMIRVNKEAMKIAYKILKTPKDQQQHTQKRPTDKQIREWFKDSSTAQ